MTETDYLSDLFDKILDSDDLEKSGIQWVSFSVILEFNPKGRLCSCDSYIYDAAGKPHSVSVNPFPLRPLAEAFEQSVRPKPDDLMKLMLLQYDRNTGEAEVQCEYEHSDRWQLTPKNLDSIPYGVRPQFQS